MKNYIIICCLIISDFVVNAQETKLIVKTRYQFNEEYDALKSNKKIKHGKYVKYATPNSRVQLLETGNYQYGEKEGEWSFFYNELDRLTENSLKEKGSYNHGRKTGIWTYYYLDTIPTATELIKHGNERRTQTVDVHLNHQNLYIRQVGHYLNDERIGEWQSFDPSGAIFQVYDFSTRQLILDKSIKDSLEFNRNRKPLYIGGLPSLLYFFAETYQLVEMNEERVKKKDSISVKINFKITKEGRVETPRIYMSSGYKRLEKEGIRLVELTGKNWIPALSRGEVIEHDCKVHICIKREVEDDPNSYATFFEILE